jgi:hypothetical protein
MPTDRDHHSRTDEISVDAILRAPMAASDPEQDIVAGRVAEDARSALWELDFALQELEWLAHESAREGPLLASIVSQMIYSARHVERFPVWRLGLPDDLAGDLAERVARLDQAIEELPEHLAADRDLVAAHERLRGSLRLRGVDVG